MLEFKIQVMKVPSTNSNESFENMYYERHKSQTKADCTPKVEQFLSVTELNRIFMPLSYTCRIKALYKYFGQKDILFTSSFGTSSAFLLHLLSSTCPSQQIHFIDTQYHFPETLAYKEQLTKLLDLQIKVVRPDAEEHAYSLANELWKKNPDACCKINKLAALEPVKQKHKVWVSGVMAHQTPHRAGLKIFEKQNGILKFHPLIDIKAADYDRYIKHYNLPEHPLKAKGFDSVGCTHCTEKGNDRNGRWVGDEKMECGLHIDYFKNKK